MRQQRDRAMKKSATWPIFPKGLYHNLSARGSVVFCLARRGLIYISSMVSRQTIHPDFFSFPCSIGLDFSSVCKESYLRVNGSFHGCVDSSFVARWIFLCFSSYFLWFFARDLFLRFWGVSVRICWWESWTVDSCIFVLDLDLRLKNFGWKPSFVLELGRILIRLDSVGLKLRIRRYSIS
jgi:hypothetical protein